MAYAKVLSNGEGRTLIVDLDDDWFFDVNDPECVWELVAYAFEQKQTWIDRDAQLNRQRSQQLKKTQERLQDRNAQNQELQRELEAMDTTNQELQRELTDMSCALEQQKQLLVDAAKNQDWQRVLAAKHAAISMFNRCERERTAQAVTRLQAKVRGRQGRARATAARRTAIEERRAARRLQLWWQSPPTWQRRLRNRLRESDARSDRARACLERVVQDRNAAVTQRTAELLALSEKYEALKASNLETETSLLSTKASYQKTKKRFSTLKRDLRRQSSNNQRPASDDEEASPPPSPSGKIIQVLQDDHRKKPPIERLVARSEMEKRGWRLDRPSTHGLKYERQLPDAHSKQITTISQHAPDLKALSWDLNRLDVEYGQAYGAANWALSTY